MKKMRTMEKHVVDFNLIQNKVDDAELELELFREGESSEEDTENAYKAAPNSSKVSNSKPL